MTKRYSFESSFSVKNMFTCCIAYKTLSKLNPMAKGLWFNKFLCTYNSVGLPWEKVVVSNYQGK